MRDKLKQEVDELREAQVGRLLQLLHCASQALTEYGADTGGVLWRRLRISAGVQLMDIVFFDGVFKNACIRTKAITSSIVPPAVEDVGTDC